METYVRERLPSVELRPASSEDQMINQILTWRDSNDINKRLGDSCINGFGLLATLLSNCQYIMCHMIYRNCI